VSGDNEVEIKCWCGVITYSDADRFTHDCDYYPQDILERDELWESL